MRGNTCFMLAVVLSLILSSCARVQKATTGEVHYVSVPEDYRALYHELAIKLGNLSKSIRYKGNGRKGETAFGVELLVANSNRGEVLLTDRVFQATTLTLDRLKDLGTHSVALSIQYPTLTRSYPRSSEYTDFYKRVAREIRRRGYILIIEMGTTFHEPEFSKMRVDYSGLTMKRFNAQLRDMAETIIKDLRPDYLTILSEPDTQARNTGLDFSVSNFATTIRHVAQGLQHPGVRLGAGAGTWNQMAYFSTLAGIPQLDYIDLHIYPVQRDFVVDRAIKIANTARKHKKGVSIGEAWLYKVSEQELGSISPVKAFARDVYSFWQPLDSLFVEIIFDLAHHLDAEFCSFFWMKYMYGYVNYDANTKTLRPQDLINKADSIAGRHILNGTLSATGEKFKTLVASGQ